MTTTTMTMNAVSSFPTENPWSSFPPSASCDSSPSKEVTSMTPYSLSFPCQKDYGLWNSPSPAALATTKGSIKKTSIDDSWGKTAPTTATTTPLRENSDSTVLFTPPKEVMICQNWQDEDDDVSILNDNPDDDDIEVLFLPQSTYDVLMPLFDELYIDEHNTNETNEGARAA